MLKCGRGSGDQQGAHLGSLSFWITAGNYPSPSISNTQLSERSKDTTAKGLITCKRWCAEAECYGLHCLFKSMLGGLCSFAKEGWQGSKATEAKAAKKVLKTELSLWPEGIPANTTLCTRDPPSLQRHAAVEIEDLCEYDSEELIQITGWEKKEKNAAYLKASQWLRCSYNQLSE